MSFVHKVVLVTGASSGIGAATAVLFAKEGAKVAIVGRKEAKLNNVARQITELGEPPLVIKADVAIEEEASTIVQKTIDKFGKLDVLINNAGIAKNASCSDPKILEAFDFMINTNLRSVVQLTSLAAPHLAETKGNIVNVSSVAAHKVISANTMPYSVSKIGLDHFTRCAAVDLAASGIRVNCVNPGPVKTDIAENSGMVPPGTSHTMLDAAKKLTILNRVSEPEEIADVIAFLASDKAKGITGSIYVSDNGMLLANVSVDIDRV